MPHEPNQPWHFEPIHDAHAIEQVAFTFQANRMLDNAKFMEVREAADKFHEEMPGRAELRTVALALAGGGAPGIGVVPSGLGSGDGLRLRRMKPDGAVESELQVERASVTFRTSLYTRWDSVWGLARKYFDAVVPMYIAQAQIAGITLTFVDKFAWTGPPTECKPSLLLRTASRYVCPHVYSAEDLWHNHTGMFLRIDNQIKRLLNVNIDCTDENSPNGPRRVVAMTTVLTDFMNQPGYETFVVAEQGATAFLHARMEELHKLGKDILGDIINDEMSRRIALLD
jgi:hypothetical protein